MYSLTDVTKLLRDSEALDEPNSPIGGTVEVGQRGILHKDAVGSRRWSVRVGFGSSTIPAP